MSNQSLASLESTDNAKVQADILDELCTMLCIGMEDYIRGFDVDLGIQVLVKLLKKTPHDNILILSIRAIALILEMIPRSCNRVVAAGATPMLIKYLATSEHNPDLAEEILKSLEKISIDDPEAILVHHGGVQAIIACTEVAPQRLHKLPAGILSNITRKVSQPSKPSKGKHSSKSKRSDVFGTKSHDIDVLITQEILPALVKLMEQAKRDAGREVVERVCVCIANVADVRVNCHAASAPNTRVTKPVYSGICSNFCINP